MKTITPFENTITIITPFTITPFINKKPPYMPIIIKLFTNAITPLKL